MNDTQRGLRLSDDELDTLRLIVKNDWRFEADPRFLREVLEGEPTQTTIRGSRHYGMLRSGVPEIILSAYSNALIGESVPKELPTYEAWQEWKARVADAHTAWVRKKDEAGE
ncbi:MULTISPECIES: hypothetical protein [Streptomyces]|uniref:Uncharacterized protein n=2 Tax=Streptomyces TaxID=1883 RepID=A0ABV9IYC0_9ACTN